MAKRKRLNKNLIVALTGVGFLVMTAAGVALVYSLQETNPLQFAKQADLAAEKGDWDAARKFYIRAYNTRREPIYLVRVGECFQEVGDDQRARGSWNEAVTQDVNLVEGWQKLVEWLIPYASVPGVDPGWLLELKQKAEGLLNALAARDGQETMAGLAEGATQATQPAVEGAHDAARALGTYALGVSLIELARQQQTEGDAVLGRQYLEESVSLDPSSVQSTSRLAQSLLEAGDVAGAETLFKNLCNVNSSPGMAAVESSIAYAMFLLNPPKSDSEQARAVLERAVELAGNDPEAQATSLTALGTLSYVDWERSLSDSSGPEDTQSVARAKELYEKAIAAYPDAFEPYIRLVGIYVRESNRADARQETETVRQKLQEAIQLNQKRLDRDIIRIGRKGSTQKAMRYRLLLQAAELYVDLARRLDATSLERQDLLDRARDRVMEAENEISGQSSTLEARATIAIAENNLREACRLTEEVDTQVGPRFTWQHKLRLARLRSQMGELGSARKAIEEALARPDVVRTAPAGLWTTYAQILTRLQDWPAAEAAAREALRRDANDILAMNLRANALNELGRKDEAEDLMQTVEKEGGAKIGEQIQDRQFRRQVQEAVLNERWDDAIQMLREKIQADPQTEDYPAALAGILRDRGRKDEAIAVLEEALIANPDSLNLHAVLDGFDESKTPEQRRADMEARVLERVQKEVTDPFDRNLELGRFYLTLNDLRKAEPHLLEAQQQFLAKATPSARATAPGILEVVLLYRLEIAFEENDLARAEQIVGTAIDQNVDLMQGRTFLGRLYLRKAEMLRDERKTDDARQLFEQAAQEFKAALETMPNNSELQLYYGECCLRLDRVSEAEIAFRQATQINPREGRAWKGLAVIAQSRGDETAFIEYVEKCRNLLPRDATVQGWATLLRERDDPAQGIARREETRRKTPDDSQNLVRLAGLYAQQGNREKAEEIFEEALRLPNVDAGGIQTAAIFFAQTGRGERGLQMLQDLVDRTENPAEKASNQLRIGSYLFNLGDRARADAAMLAAADIQANQAVCGSLGEYFLKTGRVDKSIEWYEKALALAESDNSPQASLLHRIIVECYLRTGNKEEARRRFDRFATRYPEDVDGLPLRAELESAFGDPAQAVETLARYLEQRPGDPRALFRRAQLYSAMGQWQRTCADLEQLRAAVPDAENYHPRILLARAYEMTGRRDLAEAELKSVLEREPRAANVAIQLVNFYEKYNRLADAEKVITAQLAVSPNDARWLYQAGRLAEKQQEVDKAIRLFTQACEKSEYDPTLVVALMDAFIQLRKPADGISFYENQLPPPRRNAMIMSHYAVMLAQNGQKDLAVRTFCLAVEKTGSWAISELSPIANDAASALTAAGAVDAFAGEIPDQRLQRPAQILHSLLLAGVNRPAEAIAATESLIATSGSETERGMFMVQVAMLHETVKDYEAARKRYEEALAILPDDYVALNNLAYLLMEQLHLPQQALPYARRAVEVCPSTGKPAALDTLGWVQAGLGNLDDAIGSLTDAVQRDDQYVPARVHLGEVYRRKGNFEAAIDTLVLAKKLIEDSRYAPDQALLPDLEESLRKAQAADASP